MSIRNTLNVYLNKTNDNSNKMCEMYKTNNSNNDNAIVSNQIELFVSFGALVNYQMKLRTILIGGIQQM